MSTECSDRRNETKPHRSCWSAHRNTLQESVTPSGSLLAGSTNESYNVTKSSGGKNIQDANETTELLQCGPQSTLENADRLGQIDEIIVASYSTSGSENGLNDFHDNLSTAQNTMKNEGTQHSTSLADYLRAESNNGKDETKDTSPNADSTLQSTEWELYITSPGIPMPKRPENQLYDDLILHSLDDYDENAELELELKHQNEPEEFGPITREEFIKLTFRRIKRHNAYSKLLNDTPQSYYFASQVGEGSFSTVYEAYRMETRKQYAIKVANKRQIAREKKIQYVTREKDIMATLTYGFGSHPFIASILCTFQEEDKLYYVISYAANGELLRWLRRLGSFDLQVSQFYASEIVAALEYIHECGVIHRDLKPENILISDNWHIMLTDFGSAKVIGYKGDEQPLKNQLKPIKQRSTFVGTAQYISPEVAGSRHCAETADFWALGSIIFQMIAGEAPFRGINEYKILKKINELQYKFPQGFDETAQDLVKKLLVPEVESRLGHNGIHEIKEHPFFHDVDWDNIVERQPPELRPYLPATNGEPEFYSSINAANMETGLGNNTLARLMGIPQIPQFKPVNNATQQPSSSTQQTSSNEASHLTESARRTKLEIQRRENPYHNFVDDALIVKYGLIDKKKGLFARRRVFLLTENGRLLYVDPKMNVLKGEILLSKETKTETKNFRTFFVHTPTRTYFLFDPNRHAQGWCDAIEAIRDSCYGKGEDPPKKPGAQCLNKTVIGRQFKSSVSN